MARNKIKQETKIEVKQVYVRKPKEIVNNGKWWGMDGAEMAREVFAVFKKIEKSHVFRRQMNMNLERMYLGFSPVFLSTPYQNALRPDVIGQRCVLNIAASCVDTAVSKIGTMKARPFFLTNGGDRTQRDRAEKLTDFFDGLFASINFYDTAKTAFKDGCIALNGFIYPYIDNVEKAIKVERVFPDEIMVDDIDAIYGTPKTVYRAKMLDRDDVIAMAPNMAKEILNAEPIDIQTTGGTNNCDKIWVIEAWRLPTRKGANDGRHCICIDGASLFSEAYEFNYLPFIPFGWNKRPKGYWSTSIVEEISGVQLDINVTMSKIQECHKMAAVPRVWVENSSKVNIEHITNEVGVIGKYSGIPPIFMTPNAVPPELYNHLAAQIIRGYERIGISQMDAQSIKPTGLNSGVAMKTYHDLGSQRFRDQAERFENLQMEVAERIFDLCEKLAKEKKDFSIMTPSKKTIKKINWNEARIDKEDYILQKYPTNMLPSTPEGRKDAVIDYLNSGLLSKEIAVDMLEFPDLKAAMGRVTSEGKLIDKIIDKMLEDGVYEVPEPYYSPELAMTKVRQAYLWAKAEGYHEDKLELLRNFMTSLGSLIEAKENQIAQKVSALQGMNQQMPIQQNQGV